MAQVCAICDRLMEIRALPDHCYSSILEYISHLVAMRVVIVVLCRICIHTRVNTVYIYVL